MRIVFFGASDLGFECCEAILKAGHDVVGIFTIPQEFSIKYKDSKERTSVKNVLYRDFHSLAKEYAIPIVEITEKMSEYQSNLTEMHPDFIIAIGWYYMLPESMIACAAKGAAGIHGSLLPKYRGNAPFVWAIINGETITGVSFFYFEKGIDEGDIIAQESFAIEAEDEIGNILEKAKKASIKILLEYLPLIEKDMAPKMVQSNIGATYYPKRVPEDGLIDWSWDVVTLKNFIRAQTKPYPGAFTVLNGKKVTMWQAEITSIND